MSTTASAALASLDASGISVATSLYDSTVFAAGVPVGFHPLPGVGHLMVCARRWIAATPGGDAGFYSAHTEDLEPSWFVIHGPTGQRGYVPGWGPKIPVNAVLSDRRLVAAASRAPDYLYLLSSGVVAGQPAAHVQHIRVAPGGVTFYAEEVAPSVPLRVVALGGEGTLETDTSPEPTPAAPSPSTDYVVFDKGLQYTSMYLYLYGTDAAGRIYQIRKRWADIGSTVRQSSGHTPAWEYFIGTGFSTDPGQTRPLAGVTSAGPLSFASFQYVVLMSTCVLSGTDYLARVWESRQGRPFRPTPTSVNLGSSAEGYLGHGLMLQPELEANPAMVPPGASGAIPFVVTTKASAEGNDALINTWGLHPIQL